MTTNTQVQIAQITEHFPVGMIVSEAVGYMVHAYQFEKAYEQWFTNNGVQPVLSPRQEAFEGDDETWTYTISFAYRFPTQELADQFSSDMADSLALFRKEE